MVEESTAACHRLADEAAMLAGLIDHFDLGAPAATDKGRRPNLAAVEGGHVQTRARA
jgi:hypothetical protein